MVGWAMSRAFPVGVAAVIAVVLMFWLFPWARDMHARSLTASRWVEFNPIHVEDTRQGQPPMISAGATVRESVGATVTVSVYRVDEETGEAAPICTRQYPRIYLKGEVSGSLSTFDVFTYSPPNPPCIPLRPGLYRVAKAPLLQPTGYPSKPELLISNVFRVYGEGEELAP